MIFQDGDVILIYVMIVRKVLKGGLIMKIFVDMVPTDCKDCPFVRYELRRVKKKNGSYGIIPFPPFCKEEVVPVCSFDGVSWTLGRDENGNGVCKYLEGRYVKVYK